MGRRILAVVFVLIANIGTRAAELKGKIFDAANFGIPRATITLQSELGTYTGRSTDDGQYRIAEIRPGEYLLTIKMGGFSPVSERLVVPATGLRRDFVLQVTCDETTICDSVEAPTPKFPEIPPNLENFILLSDISRFRLPGTLR